MATPFSECLAKTRAWAGFKTAHEFYSKSGGRRVLDLSWVAYRKIEKGLILPKPGRLSLLVALLRLTPGSPHARELVRTYLRTLLGSDQAYQWILGMAGKPSASDQPQGAGERALTRLVHAETYQLSAKQDQAVIANFASYWSFMVLCGGVESWTLQDLAAKLGISKRELRPALGKLVQVGLAEFLEDGRVRCPLADKRVQLLPLQSRSTQDMERIMACHERMARPGGALLWHTYSLPRANEYELYEFFPSLSRAVSGVHAFVKCERAEGEPPTPIFLVEARVFRLPL